MSSPSFTVELLQRQNRDLREENDELRETVRQLKAREVAVADLPDWLPHLTRTETALLRMLAPGRLVSTDQIFERFYGDRANPPSDDLPRIWIRKLRAKLDASGIEIICRWGQGYQLTPASRDLLAVKSREAA